MPAINDENNEAVADALLLHWEEDQRIRKRIGAARAQRTMGNVAIRELDWRIKLLDHVAANMARKHAGSNDPTFWANLPEADKDHWRSVAREGLMIVRAAVMDSAIPGKGDLATWLERLD